MSASKLTPRILAVLALLLLLGRSASAAPKPASETNAPISAVTVAYDVSGVLPGDLPPVVSLIIDRTQLQPGDQLPELDQTQILVTESGSLQLTDGVGITSNLDDNRQVYAPRGSVSRVTATTTTQILRAHIDASAETNGLVTITESTCSPSTLALPVDRPLTVINQTDRPQPFSVGGIHEELAPGAWRTIPVSNLTQGTWAASCGQQTTGATPLALVTISIENTPPASAASNAATTTLLDHRIVLGRQAFASFFLQRIDLAAGATIDTSQFSGPTALIASDQSLAMLRPDHRLVIVPAQSPVLFSGDEQTLISNQGGFPATLLVAGFRTSAIASAPVNRTPDPATLTASPAIESYFPADVDVFGVGFLMMDAAPMTSFASSIFGGISDLGTIQAWQTGMVRYYAPIDSPTPGIFGAISVDRFATADAAHAALQLLYAPALSPNDSTNALDPPTSTADETVAFTGFYASSQTAATIILGRYGADIVAVVVGTPLGVSSTDRAFKLWSVVESTQSTTDGN